MKKKQAREELAKVEKINTFGWTVYELAELTEYKNYLQNILRGGQKK